MPKVIQNEDGTEETFFTQEELDAKAAEEATAKTAEFEAEKVKLQEEHEKALEEKEGHVKEKLGEFLQGKEGLKKKEEEMAAASKTIEERTAAAEAIAKEASEKVALAEASIITSAKNASFQRHGGADEEVAAKLEEGFKMINLEKLDTETMEEFVARKVDLAARAIGITGGTNEEVPAVPFGSAGYTPTPAPASERISDEQHQTFNEEIGLPELNQEQK